MTPKNPLPGPGETIVIEASAGTGKTWTISDLAARFISEAGVDISQIAIVTFSATAAGEVRSRTWARLHQYCVTLASSTPPSPQSDSACQWPSDPRERLIRLNRVDKALNDFDLAPIMTTHGFCDHLLACLGILADHDPSDRLATDLAQMSTAVTSDHYLCLRQNGHPAFSYDQALAWTRAALFAPDAAISPGGTDQARFVEGVRTGIERTKRRAGMYTFDDMLVRCRDALCDPATAVQARTRLSGSYPVLLVDEFQDTDSVQWQILQSGFVGASTVVLIGDPKQSIYGFRGADVGSYLAATNIAKVTSLRTNHRSSPAIVEAVGALMNGAELGDPGIRVTPVDPSAATPRLICGPSDPWGHPFRLRMPPEPRPMAAGQARTWIDTDLVNDLVRLLDNPPSYCPSPDKPPRPLGPSDVAIIVATNTRGAGLADRLHQAGIPAVFTGTGSVLATWAARDWLVLLHALRSGTSGWIRAASLTSLIGWDLERLIHADAEEISRLTVLTRWLGALLSQHGPMAVLEGLSDQTDLVSRLSTCPDGERTWMDLRHIGQLLAQPHPPLVSPAEWLQTACLVGAGVDDSTRPWPTHGDAVRILTVHQAKGLQFPVVYLPQLADRHVFTPQPGQPSVVHDGTGSRVVDLGLAPSFGTTRTLEDEESGESLRACYVALTRATTQVTTWWVPTSRNTQSSPLHRLLFRESDSPAAQISLSGRDPRRSAITSIQVETMPEVIKPGRLSSSRTGQEHVIGTAPSRRSAHDRDSATDSTGAIETTSSATTDTSPTTGTLDMETSPEFNRVIDHSWRRTSFSALTVEAHLFTPETDEPDTGAHTAALSSAEDLRPDLLNPNDAVVGSKQALSPDGSSVGDNALDQLSPMADLPGGVAFGSLVHSIFEYADPADPDLTPLVARTMNHTGFTGFTAEALAQALMPGLTTPLGPIADNLSLAEIPVHDRLAEMVFEIPLSHQDRAANRDSIAHLLAQHIPPGDPLAAYPDRLSASAVDGGDLRGYMSGSIDAVLRVGDRYLIVDYKTNRLGPPGSPLTLRHYTLASMSAAMMSSQYPLQALFYSVALHRFLRWRLPDYDAARHLGGIAYLFVRGMAGPDTPLSHGTPCGVFPFRPAPHLVEDLSDLLSGVAR
ncbi:MAG: UvrD-helicase domain-containing protein [Propionibacteriaceae bacterium]|nr:UvrD-helicase domain-containing protein [Propionibacteriaceae bacterium]